MVRNILAQPDGDTKPLLVPSAHFLPSKLRRDRHIHLPALQRGQFHDYLRAAVEAAKRGDEILAQHLIGLTARVAAEKGISACDL